MKGSYKEQLAIARDTYFDREDSKGMGYLANLEMGDWLTQNYNWDWYTTHTFKNETITRGQANQAWQSWLNSLILDSRARGLPRPHYVRATEYQENRPGQTIHFHALIGGVGEVRRLLFKDMWELYGYARVEKYDPSKGAGFYLGKYLTKYDSELRVSRNMKHRKVN